jgi:hypothetical protein
MGVRQRIPKEPTASQMFLGAIEQIVRAFREPQEQDAHEPSIQAIEALRQKQAEHEEQRRRIAQTIANGARLSRNRPL